MNKKLAMIIMMLICAFLCVSCVKKPESVKIDGINVAVESSVPTIDEALAEKDEIHSRWVNLTDNSVEEQNKEIILKSSNLYIHENVETIEGKKIIIDGFVNTSNTDYISRYQYVLLPITEEFRQELFEAYFGERVTEVEYDEKNDLWRLNNSSSGGDYYLYTTPYPCAGPTVSGEEVFQIEYRAVDLYPFRDNLLEDVTKSVSKVTLDEAVKMCGSIITELSGFENVNIDYVHAFGTAGRIPYYKIVFKKYLDKLPVTGYNDLYFLVDDKGIEKVYGAIYDVEKIRLETPILSAQDAVDILKSNSTLIDFEENALFIGKITLEYIVINSLLGETYVTPIWRFCIGDTESKRNVFRDRILAVDAVTGDIIQEERGNTF